MRAVSAVIVNWNSGVALTDCVASLVGEGWDASWDVVVVDNASTDGSERAVARAYPPVSLVQNACNRGYAAAVNQGLAVARGDLVLILNPDVVVTPMTVRGLVEFMHHYPKAAVVGPRLFNADGTVQGSARRAPSAWTGLFGRSTPLTNLFPNNPLSRRELPGMWSTSENPLAVDWLAGSCLLVRRSAWEQVGVMDERFFLYFEDADWCIRFREAGWQVYYLPTVRATHRVGESRKRRVLRSTIDLHRSAYYFYRKHYFSSPWHPVAPVLAGGLLLHFGVRLLQTLAARREQPRAKPVSLDSSTSLQ
jgi:GT2 family glycosyltransferase